MHIEERRARKRKIAREHERAREKECVFVCEGIIENIRKLNLFPFYLPTPIQ